MTGNKRERRAVVERERLLSARASAAVQRGTQSVENSHRFFENQSCKYFPCHDGMEGADFNCLFCYCPLSPYADCPGNPVFRKNKSGHTLKDCTGCTFPHVPENYDALLAFLKEKIGRSD